MSDKSILAYFQSPNEAEQALKQMGPLRLIDSSIDRISRFPGEGVERRMSPRTGDFPGIGELTQSADFSDNNAAILAANDVTAHGLSDGGQHAVTGRDILLTVVVDEADYERAKRIVEQNGGTAGTA